jgi:hypothetical protein
LIWESPVSIPLATEWLRVSEAAEIGLLPQIRMVRFPKDVS